MTTCTPAALSEAITAGASWPRSRSRTSSTICRPRMPPSALTRSRAISTPSSCWRARGAAFPLSGKTAPMRIGSVARQARSPRAPATSAMATTMPTAALRSMNDKDHLLGEDTWVERGVIGRNKLGLEDVCARVHRQVLLELVVHRDQDVVDEQVHVALVGPDGGRGLGHDPRVPQRKHDMDAPAGDHLVGGRLQDRDHRRR